MDQIELVTAAFVPQIQAIIVRELVQIGVGFSEAHPDAPRAKVAQPA